MSLVVTVDLVVVAQYACTLLLAYYCVQFGGIFFEWPVARAAVDPALAEAPSGGKTFDLKAHESAGAYGKLDTSVVRCWDPCTLADLGSVPATAPSDVVAAVARCRAAQATWANSTFAQRRTLMKIMLRFVVENQATIARVAVRDSGKTLTDAIFGEVLVTCEKLKWLAHSGEAALAPEVRETGSMVWFTKKVHVEYRPLGVIGAIVCANQIFNPTSMCAYSNVLTRALPPCFENSLRAIDSSKNQPNRLRFDRAREF